MRPKASNKTKTTTTRTPSKLILYLPPGASLSDLVMDAQQVIQELFIPNEPCLTGAVAAEYLIQMNSERYFILNRKLRRF